MSPRRKRMVHKRPLVVVQDRSCWGAKVQCVGTEWCSPNFLAGPRHFKTKFCSHCKEELAVPAERVRALNERLEAFFVNRHASGLWTELPPHMGGGKYRVINHSKGCVGTHMAIFEGVPPAMNWPPLPQSWVSDDGYVRLYLSKGTLIPAKLRRCTRAKVIVPSAFMHNVIDTHVFEAGVLPPELAMHVTDQATGHEEEDQEDGGDGEEGEDGGEEEEEEEDEVGHFGLAPLSAIGCDSPSSSEAASVASAHTPILAVTDKRMDRMMRNRRSAAASRERKRQYIDSLECHVQNLSEQVKRLCEENSLLRSANLCLEENTLWSAVLDD